MGKGQLQSVCLGCDFPPWLLQVKLMDLDNPVSRKLREVVERIRQERARFMKVGLLFHKCCFIWNSFIVCVYIYTNVFCSITV